MHDHRNVEAKRADRSALGFAHTLLHSGAVAAVILGGAACTAQDRSPEAPDVPTTLELLPVDEQNLDAVAGEWVLADGYHDIIDVDEDTVVSLRIIKLNPRSAPLQIEASLGCGLVGGGTSADDVLRVTEVTFQSPGCAPGLAETEARVALLLLDALPSAMVSDDDQLVVQTQSGELRFWR